MSNKTSKTPRSLYKLAKDAKLRELHPRAFASIRGRRVDADCRQCGYDYIIGRATCAFCGATGNQR